MSSSSEKHQELTRSELESLLSEHPEWSWTKCFMKLVLKKLGSSSLTYAPGDLHKTILANSSTQSLEQQLQGALKVWAINTRMRESMSDLIYFTLPSEVDDGSLLFVSAILPSGQHLEIGVSANGVGVSYFVRDVLQWQRIIPHQCFVNGPNAH